MPCLGTHSCKATLLSWASKFGLPLETRRILGHHRLSLRGESSTLSYSRDAMAEPVRQLERLLRDIRSGAFDPDRTRSGYKSLGANEDVAAAEGAADLGCPGDELVQRGAEVVAGEAEQEQEDTAAEVEPCGSDVSERGIVSSSDVSTSDSSGASFQHAEAVALGTDQNPSGSAAEATQGYAYHLGSLKTHRLAALDGAALRTACGRTVSTAFRMGESPLCAAERCMRCFAAWPQG